ncbi:MAG TPA: hypothetical protein V6C99_08995 [Oculatellaceae cyanobacterium]|jgi:uncharacterized membrane protein
MRIGVILGILVCIAGLILLAMPNTWVDWQQVASGNVRETSIQVVRIPQWVAPTTIALGLLLIMLGFARQPKRH